MPCLLWNSLNVNNHFCSGIKCFIADCMLGLTYGSMMLVMLFILIITLYSSIVELRNQLHDWFHMTSIAGPCIGSCFTLYSFCNSAHQVTALVIIFFISWFFCLFYSISFCSEVSLFWISTFKPGFGWQWWWWRWWWWWCVCVCVCMHMHVCVCIYIYIYIYIYIHTWILQEKNFSSRESNPGPLVF